MNTTTLTALVGSVLKWHRIMNSTGWDEGMENCPLCQEFYQKVCQEFYQKDYSTDMHRCTGCPVYEHTGMDGCSNTPIDDWEDGESFHDAKRERDFLINLIEPIELRNIMVELLNAKT